MRLPEAALVHAERAYPLESGGFLIETPGGVIYYPLTNSAANPTHQFRIMPMERVRAEALGRIVGFVHSHPDDSAEPSGADLREHQDSGLWDFIISVYGGRVVDVVRLQPLGSPRRSLLGRKFVHGEDDCYTLVRDYYGAYEGIELIDVEREDEWWNKGKDLYRQYLPEAGFYEIPKVEVRPGDLILMRVLSRVENHSAVWLGDGVIIHHLYDQISMTDDYRDSLVRRTSSFWRHSQKGDPSWTSWRQVW